MKKIYFLNKIFIYCAVIMCCISLSLFFVNANPILGKSNDIVAQSVEEIDTPSYAIDEIGSSSNENVSGTFINNLVFVNFKGEDNVFTNQTFYNNYSSYETFDIMYNTGDYSVKKYYDYCSNGRLTLNTNFTKQTTDDLKIYTTSMPKTYYSPYIINNNGSYAINTDGYFDYAVVECSNSSYINTEADVYNLNVNFFMNSTLIANVYKMPSGLSGTEQSAIASGDTSTILNYTQAQILADGNANYYLVSMPNRYMREVEFMYEIFSSAKNDISTTGIDTNNDNYIDSFMVGLADTQTSAQLMTNWSDLLWSHKWEMSWVATNISGYINTTTKPALITKLTSFGYPNANATNLISYLQSEPKLSSGQELDTIALINYTANGRAPIYDLTTEENWTKLIQSTSATIHELGHILSLPDLYEYSNNSSESVGRWSQMSSSNFKPSFFTSYEREKLGWLDAGTNIVDITTNGSYVLNVVKGKDNSNVVAYRLSDSNYPNQYFYIEYRNVSNASSIYDTQAGYKSGILIYRVLTTNQEFGNRNGEPYEIYVVRDSSTTFDYAPLSKDKYAGVSTRYADVGGPYLKLYKGSETTLSNVPNFFVYVSEINDTTATLKINVKEETQSYTPADFDNNTILFDKLKSIAGTEELNRNSFASETILNLGQCEIRNLDFLSLFYIPNLEALDLTCNYLTEDVNFSKLLETYTNIVDISVVGNLIDLSKISTDLITNQIICWGLQFNSENPNSTGTKLSYQYYYRNSAIIPDAVSASIDGEKLSKKCKNGVIEIWEKSDVGEHKIVFTYNSTYYGNGAQINRSRFLIPVSNLYVEDNPYPILKGETFPEAADLVSTGGTTTTVIEYLSPIPDTSITGSGYVQVVIKNSGVVIGTYNVYYVIFNEPEISFIGVNGNHQYIPQNSVYAENGITISEDGVVVGYTQSDAGTARTYKIAYYEVSSYTDDATYNVGANVTNIDTSVLGKIFVARFTITNTYGKVFTYDKLITISSTLILKESMDEKIYNRLLELTGKDDLFSDDFKDYDYIDLAQIETTSIRGLDQLIFKSGVIVDLCDNKLNNMTEIDSFLNIQEQSLSGLSALLLVFNNFAKTDIDSLIQTRRVVCMFGIQQIDTEYIFANTDSAYITHIYNDYNYNFNTLLPNLSYESSTGMLKGSVAGSYNIKFTVKNRTEQYVKSFVVIVISNKNASITKEYSDPFTFDAGEIFDIQGVSIDNLVIKTNKDELSFTTIGTKELIVNFAYGSKNIDLIQSYNIVDTVAPIMKIDGDEILYLISKQDYVNNYSDDVVSSTDAYDGECNVVIDKADTILDNGKFEIVYSSTDSSGNKSTLTRTIYIGYARLKQETEDANYNEKYVLPLEFKTYTKDDFTITYKIDDSESQNYVEENGLLFLQYKQFTIKINLVHNKNNSIVYNYTIVVSVDDREKPIIILLGQTTEEIFAGQKYVEAGYKLTDNSTSETMTPEHNVDGLYVGLSYKYSKDGSTFENVKTFDTKKVGTYQLVYTATDRANNSSVKIRTINIVYYPIDNIEIDKSLLLSRYGEGKMVSFTIIVESDYIIDTEPYIIWIVDGQEKVLKGMTAEFIFNDSGTHTVQAKLYTDKDIETEEVSFEIYKSSIYVTIALITGCVLGVITICWIAGYFINKYKNRNFY